MSSWFRFRLLDDRQRVFYVALNMAVVFLITAITSIYILYRTSFAQQEERLRETAQSHARQIESIARYDAIHVPDDDSGGWRAGTISQVADAHRNFKGFGRTGEYLIARRKGDDVVFLVGHRHYDIHNPAPVPLGSGRAEPMARALGGASGTMIGRDYRGVKVLAAFEPVDILDLGLVVKIDLDEIRSPFIKAAVLTGTVSIAVILLGILIFIRAINPMLHQIEEGGKQFRLAVESSPSAMIMSDSRGRIVFVNLMAVNMFGYSREEFLGRTVEDLMPHQDRGNHVRLRGEYWKTRESRPMRAGRELRARRKNGSAFPAEIVLNPVPTPGGTLVLASIVDITERCGMQKKLMQSESLAAIGSMATVVAHEIRNPLGSIVTAAKSLSRGGLSREDRETLLSVLGTESERLNKTLKDFLEFARPRELRLKNGDLNQVVLEVLRAIRADSSLLEDIIIEESIDEQLREFPFDSDQFRQILWNLILNGIESMEGRGRLHVRTREEEGAVRLSISDSGPGIPPEELDEIFKPFHTTKKQGTGLGLAISRRIVESHGGRIEVMSRPGKGAEFTVIIPTRTDVAT